MVAAAGASLAFRALTFLTVASAIVGFGACALEPFALGRQREATRFDDVERYAIARACSGPRARAAERALLAMVCSGAGAVAVPDAPMGFGDTWVWLSLALGATALAVTAVWLRPTRQRLLVDLGGLAGVGSTGGGAQYAAKRGEVEALERRISWGCAAMDVLGAAILALAIWQPGG